MRYLLSAIVLLATFGISNADHPQRVRARVAPVAVRQNVQVVRHRHVQPIFAQSFYAQSFLQPFAASYVQPFALQSFAAPCVQSFAAPYAACNECSALAVQSFAAPVVFRQRAFARYRLPGYLGLGGFGFGFGR